ncbi:MAG TPA: aminotransferase class V-fold PLP-dependent enzyme [Candidatus Moranbacteria bacterium]|nr:aminotransferase class V-fold PLP-dependent enzyme [Candidatus Moranbacteria bacterium]
MKKIYYFDHAATTPVDKEVLAEMMPYFSEKFGNPGGIYNLGMEAKAAIDKSRQQVAEFLRASSSDEIIFTPGGTASVNLALKGLMNALKEKTGVAGHIITSAVEHHAVLDTTERLVKQGFTATVVPVDKDGLVSLQDIEKSVRAETVLISVMTANNEIGTLQPIEEIGKWLEDLNDQRSKEDLGKIYFHTDACQAAGALDLNVQNLKVDMLTINGSKIYGPKGIGALFAKIETPLWPLLDGGGQEKNLVSGTENVPAIIGLAKAVQLAKQNREQENARLSKLRDYLFNEIQKNIPKVRLNGHAKKRLPNNVNVSILDVEGEAVLLHLNQLSIAAATGSACTSDSLEPSYVIRALGLPYEAAHGSMRFTLGKLTDRTEVDYLLKHLPGIITQLRKISPVNVSLESVEEAMQKAKREVRELGS